MRGEGKREGEINNASSRWKGKINFAEILKFNSRIYLYFWKEF